MVSASLNASLMDNMTYPYVHLLHVLNLTKEVNTQILHSYVLISNLSYFRFRTARATVVIGLHYWEDWSFVALVWFNGTRWTDQYTGSFNGQVTLYQPLLQLRAGVHL